MAKTSKENLQTWKKATDLSAVKSLVDRGLVLTQAEFKQFEKICGEEDLLALCEHLGLRFSERSEDRLAQEIIVETFLCILSEKPNEAYLQSFLSSVLENAEISASKAALRFVEISTQMHFVDQANEQRLHALAVSCVCELGTAVRFSGENFPGTEQEKKNLLSQLSTFLLSLSNSDESTIRYSLFHYFAQIESGQDYKPSFTKVLNRFGHTALDQLFSILFHKKYESLALQFLTENLIYLLDSDRHAQQILHDTMRYYMLKKPERFGLFVQSLADYIKHLSSETSEMAAKPALKEVRLGLVVRHYLQHISTLFGIANELGHRELGGELLNAMSKFNNQLAYSEYLNIMAADVKLRRPFKDLISDVIKAHKQNQKSGERINRFMNVKRGRKPSFTKSTPMQSARLIAELAAVDILQNAS